MTGLKQRRHMQKMRDARVTPKSTGKENEPNSQSSLSPKSRAIQDHKHRADAAEISEKKIIRENEQLKREHKNSARREKRHRQKINKLKQRVKEAEDELQKATAHGEAQVRKILKRKAEDENGWRRRLVDAERRLGEAEQCRARTTEELKTKIGALAQLRAVLRLARRQIAYQKSVRERSKNGSRTAKHILRMHAKRGRAYKVELRAIAHVLVSSGYKEGKVGDLMQDIARIFSVDLDCAMSRWTVRCAVLEGLVASQVQLGVEMKYSDGISAKYLVFQPLIMFVDITMSSDSTSRRKMNYQSHHIHMRAPVKNTDGSVSLSTDPKIRFLGIASTVDHSTATSKAAWLTIYNNIISTYNASPLGIRLGTLDLRMICRVLHGMCGDHANNEKALSEAWKELKHDLLLQELGEEHLRQLNEQIDELRELKQRSVLGNRRLLTIWIWTGFCMHKDQNSFKGGNTQMTMNWKELGITGPIPLANKESAVAVRRVLHPEDGDKPPSEDDPSSSPFTIRVVFVNPRKLRSMPSPSTPEFVLDFDEEQYRIATFDGQPVARGEVMVEIKKLYHSGKLLYLREMFVRFLEGAKSTWIRFSSVGIIPVYKASQITPSPLDHSEFAPGGLIDRLNDAEKGRIWLPATNDQNEDPGLHGYVVLTRGSPVHDARGAAHASGLEHKRKELQMEYNHRILAEKAQKVADAAAKAAEIRDRLDATVLISSVEDIYRKSMTRDKLQGCCDIQDHAKLLAASSEQNMRYSGPQMAEGFVREHYHSDDEDFGEFEGDAATF
ncbi:hypothetical protein B0H13DRAFT_2275018 [Mycena leptocephala]|nr:hypothetical protein B0H13DRAFT_2275018 [Mycena leptocephala]